MRNVFFGWFKHVCKKKTQNKKKLKIKQLPNIKSNTNTYLNTEHTHSKLSKHKKQKNKKSWLKQMTYQIAHVEYYLECVED